ncbi:MAG: hypothetical protein R3D52_00870 [Xanthobacteraceae bacterium]
MSTMETGRLSLRVSASFVDQVDEWRRRQPDIPTRAEAARRLILLGIQATSGKKNKEIEARPVVRKRKSHS